MDNGFIIAGTKSGVGKTTICMGLTQILAEKGATVQTFKIGPDYIDPGFHSKVSGRACINLDSWVDKPEEIISLYEKYSRDADISIVEGVMGLFDGSADNLKAGSTAHIAKILGLPVILAVDAAGMGQSVAALVLGFENFDKNIKFAGIILSRTGSKRHVEILSAAIAEHSSLPVIGHIPRQDALHLNKRHLGLKTAEEVDENFFLELGSAFSDLKKSPFFDLLLSSSKKKKNTPQKEISRTSFNPPDPHGGRPVIMVARDEAFSFYYHENLKILEDFGLEIKFFSPAHDSTIPKDARGIYLGGGYPELHAGILSANTSMLDSIRSSVEAGMPVYAECGGFVYLCQGVNTPDSTAGGKEKFFPMAGIFPARINMGRKTLRYVEVCLNKDSIFGGKGESIRGHEYHYTQEEKVTAMKTEGTRPFFVNGSDGVKTEDGYTYKNCIGSYIHFFFSSNKKFIKSFTDFVNA